MFLHDWWHGGRIRSKLRRRHAAHRRLSLSVLPRGFEPLEVRCLLSGSPLSTIVPALVAPNDSATTGTVTSLSGAVTATAGQSPSFYSHVYLANSHVLATVGAVTLFDGSTELAAVSVNSSGEAVLPAGKLSVGSYTITAQYDGTASFAASTSNTIQLTVLPSGPTRSTGFDTSFSMTFANQPATYETELVGPVSGTPATGTLTLSAEGNVLYSLNVASTPVNSSGYYVMPLASIPDGQYPLVVTYSGDSNYDGYASAVVELVQNDKLSVQDSSTAAVGQPYTVLAAINTAAGITTSAGGTLTLLEGTTALASVNLAKATPNSSGYYTLADTAGFAAAGTQTLSVAYSGDSNHDATTSSTFTCTVTSPLVTTSLGTSGSSSVQAGQAYTLLARIDTPTGVTTAATGTLSLMQGTATLASVNLATATPNSSGYYTLADTAGFATAGSYSLSVVYSGDSSYAAATYNFTCTVTSSLVATSLGTSGSSSVQAGQAYTLLARIDTPSGFTTAATGTLSLLEGTTALASVNLATATPNSSGYYTLADTAGFATAGSYGLSVVYSGDSTYAAATYNFTCTVTSPLVATSLGTSGSSSVQAGQAYTLLARIDTPTGVTTAATGTLSLMQGTTALASVNLATATPNSNGYYTLADTAGFATAGSYSLSVVYSGDSTYAAATYNFTCTVTSSLVATSLGTSGSSSVQAGQAYTLLARIDTPTGVTTAATGTLSLMQGTATLASVNLATATPNSSGYYTLADTAGFTTAGSYSLSVVYSGNSTYAAATYNFTCTVTLSTAAAPAFTLTGPTAGTFSAGQSVTIGWTAANVDVGGPTKITLGYDPDAAAFDADQRWIEVDGVIAANGTSSYSWNTTGVASGTYHLSGYMYDFSNGQAVFSHLTTSIVITGGAPPAFTLTGPGVETSAPGQTVTIQWSAANVDLSGPTKITLGYDRDAAAFDANQHWLEIDGVAAANGTGSYAWNTSGMAAGTYYLSGYMYDFSTGQAVFSHLTTSIVIT